MKDIYRLVRFRSVQGGVAALLLFSATACHDSDSGSTDTLDLQARIEKTLPSAIDRGVRSVEAVTAADNWRALSGVTTTADRALPTLFGDRATASGVAGSDSSPTEALPSSGDEVASFLSTRILTADNRHDDDYYKIRGEDVCPEDPDTGAQDSECIEAVNLADLYLRATPVGEAGADLALAIGPDRVEPLGAELRENRAGLWLDLPETGRALTWLATVFPDSIGVPDTMLGRVELNLVADSDDHVSLALAIVEFILIEWADGGDSFLIAAEARNPLAAIDVLGEEQVSLAVDIGRTQLRAPWSAIAEESLATGTFALDWQGLTASTTMRAEDDSFTIHGISLGQGPSTATLDDHPLLTVDLNPETGRSFDLVLTEDPNGNATLSIDPEFDLYVALGLEPLATAGDDIPHHLRNETYRVHLAADEGPAQVREVGDDAFELLSGQFDLTSTGSPDSVTVLAGQCLREDEVTPGEHPILGAFTADSCN